MTDINPEQATFLLNFLAPQVEEEAKTTSRVLAAVPVEKCEYKPADPNMCAMELVRHIPGTELWFLQGILKGSFGMEGEAPLSGLKTPAEVVAAYERELPVLLGKVKSLPPEKLAEPVDFFGIATLPAVAYLNFLIKHSVHHRGQLSAYLRPMNARVPSIYGGSYDEPMTGAATNA